eukprot:TRINITY_DN29330_c0_g1_i1.p1 TRINITY_DN29330_c0_g1~~TRINITY_DN29330_c0_g1_i1.p1  ORF type:complete len:115 (+),score=17.46 TRINITY_DN29330_c0_g1_i1:159-503(+)
MNDCLPTQSPLWQKVENTVKHVVSAYGYNEVRMPIVEMTNLFSRAIGEVTDVVRKRMYTFEDRNGSSLTLRLKAPLAVYVLVSVKRFDFNNLRAAFMVQSGPSVLCVDYVAVVV